MMLPLPFTLLNPIFTTPFLSFGTLLSRNKFKWISPLSFAEVQKVFDILMICYIHDSMMNAS